MLTFEEANKLVLKDHKDAHINQTFDAGKKFIIDLEPNNLKEGVTSLDGFFSVDKVSGEVKEYSPVMDPEEFKNAMKHIVYKEG